MKRTSVDKICCFLSELLGTLMLVFLGCMGCTETSQIPNSFAISSLNFGLVVMIVIQCFGCVSGAHINPAVTVAALIYNILPLSMAMIYISGQILGAFIGYGLLKLVVPVNAIRIPGAEHAVCVTVPHSDLTTVQAVAIEFLLTSVLILFCCGVWDPRNTKFQDSIGLRFGFTVACLALTGGRFTGASMNPARSFAPALWNYDFENHYIYWMGPLAASIVSSLCYKYIFRRECNDRLLSKEEVPLS